MIAIDLGKQQGLNDDIYQRRITAMFFILEEGNKKEHFRFFTRNCESIVKLFYFSTYQYKTTQYNSKIIWLTSWLPIKNETCLTIRLS